MKPIQKGPKPVPTTVIEGMLHVLSGTGTAGGGRTRNDVQGGVQGQQKFLHF